MVLDCWHLREGLPQGSWVLGSLLGCSGGLVHRLTMGLRGRSKWSYVGILSGLTKSTEPPSTRGPGTSRQVTWIFEYMNAPYLDTVDP